MASVIIITIRLLCSNNWTWSELF